MTSCCNRLPTGLSLFESIQTITFVAYRYKHAIQWQSCSSKTLFLDRCHFTITLLGADIYIRYGVIITSSMTFSTHFYRLLYCFLWLYQWWWKKQLVYVQIRTNVCTLPDISRFLEWHQAKLQPDEFYFVNNTMTLLKPLFALKNYFSRSYVTRSSENQNSNHVRKKIYYLKKVESQLALSKVESQFIYYAWKLYDFAKKW